MVNPVCFFDFDGTLTRTRGGDSPLFIQWRLLVDDDICATYQSMKDLFETVFASENGEAEKRLLSFFQVLHDCGYVIAIESNNYREIVLAFIIHQLRIPLAWITLDMSSFREDALSKSATIGHYFEEYTSKGIPIDFYYFDDSIDDIYAAQERAQGQLNIINCDRGKRCINELLKEIPVNTSKDLDVFLEQFSNK